MDISREAYGLANIDGFLSQELQVPVKQVLEGTFGRKRTADEWLSQGSIDEDNQLRFFNHFYDPIHNRGLDATGRLLPSGTPVPLRGERSHEWGIEDPREIDGQDFSYRDAREYFRLSLTARDPKERERRLADTFYALGHVIHLIQDLASPAHTRNGPHGGQILLFDVGPRSVVERYLDLDGVRQALKFDGYPIPKQGFTKPRDFWVETDASGAPLNGPDARGLSQIINRNFVSEGMNFTAFVDGNHHPEYPDPILKTADCYEELIDTQDAERRPIRGLVQFCRNSFRDPNTGIVETNPRMATFSLFGRDLQELGFFVPQGFSLNALNAVSIGELTIPRAVGYSAGLLAYFFRGTFDFLVSFQPQFEPDSFGTIITNTSGERMGGTFTAYIDDTNGIRSPVEGASFDLSLGPGANSTSLHFPLSPPTSERSLVLVFQGRLGNEEGAVAAKIKRVGGPHWVATGSGGVSTYRIPGIEPITVTMKFKNVQIGRIEALAVDEDGGPATDLITGAGTGSLDVTGSEPDFTTFTVTLKPPIPRRPVATQLSVGATLNPGGFICISEISGLARPSLVNVSNSGFEPATCPE